MLYLSTLIGKHISAAGGTRIGHVVDLVANLETPEEIDSKSVNRRPALWITGVVARKGLRGREMYIPVEAIDRLGSKGVVLCGDDIGFPDFEWHDGDVLLTRDMWDKQIIDLKQRKVVRVNDILLEARTLDADEGEPALKVSGVDVSLGSLLRRVRLSSLVRGITRKSLPAQVVEWDDMEMFGTNLPGSIRVQHKRLASMHPVEIARITDALSYRQGAELISALQDTLAADTIEEINPERQTDIVEQLPDDLAADIIEEMAPDEATDLLDVLPEDKAAALLEAMDEERAATLRTLMRYPDRTAGRAMTTDFVCVRPQMTVDEVIEANKSKFMSADLIYYMYVTVSEDDDTLAGVITVRDLLVQSKETPVRDFMLTSFIAVRPGEHEREVARKMAEYNLLALPVVDRNNKLQGVITIDDALDSLLPAGWKRHLPRIFN